MRGSCYSIHCWRRSDISTSELKSWLQPKSRHVVVREVAERAQPAHAGGALPHGRLSAGRVEAEGQRRGAGHGEVHPPGLGRVLASVGRRGRARLAKEEPVSSLLLVSQAGAERLPLERAPALGEALLESERPHASLEAVALAQRARCQQRQSVLQLRRSQSPSGFSELRLA